MVRLLISNTYSSVGSYEFDLIVQKTLVKFLNSSSEFFIVSKESISCLKDLRFFNTPFVTKRIYNRRLITDFFKSFYILNNTVK